MHAESLRILDEVGVKFLGDKAIPILKKNGAKVDEDRKIARLPKQMVKEALLSGTQIICVGSQEPGLRFPAAVTYNALLH